MCRSGFLRTFLNAKCGPSWVATERQVWGHSTWRGFSTEAAATTGQRRGPVSFLSLGLTAATGAGLMLWFQNVQREKLKAVTTKTESVGKAAIGGPFDLIDQNGKPFTEKNLLGKFALVYFGFTFCPDICPDELEKMAQAINSIDKELGYELQPVFISIDPERDTVPQVKEYVREFHPRMIGLTGPIEKVKEAARQYRVYYTKTNDTEDYLVDHSIIMYLIDPQGAFVTFYGKNFTAEQLASSLSEHIRNWQKQQS